MPGGTNLPVLGDLGRGSQTPYPYDAYPHLSSNAEIPIGRVFPPSFGMWTRRIG